MDGLGRLTMAECEYYGEQREGVLHGRGVQSYHSPQSLLVGHFKFGYISRGQTLPHSILSPSVAVYALLMAPLLLRTRAGVQLAGGIRYCGHFKGGKAHGVGVFHFLAPADVAGQRYCGHLEYGQRVGHGQLTLADGSSRLVHSKSQRCDEEAAPPAPMGRLLTADDEARDLKDDDGCWVREGRPPRHSSSSFTAHCTRYVTPTGTLLLCVIRTADEFVADSGCVYLGTACGEPLRFHGVGRWIHPKSFLGPTQSVSGAWRHGELVGVNVEAAHGSASSHYISVPEALAFCRQQGVCTGLVTGDVPLSQYLYACDTCVRAVCDTRRAEEKEEDAGAHVAVVLLVCHTCAVLGDCHRGHVLIPLGVCKHSRCDCGRGQVSLLRPHHTRMMEEALAHLRPPADEESEAAELTSSSSPSLSSPFPPPPLWEDGANGSRVFTPECALQLKKQSKKELVLVKWLGWALSFNTWSPTAPPTTSASVLSAPAVPHPTVRVECREPMSNRQACEKALPRLRQLLECQRQWRRMTVEQRGAVAYPTHPLSGERMGDENVAPSLPPPSWSKGPRCSTLARTAAWELDWRYLRPLELLALVQEAETRMAAKKRGRQAREEEEAERKAAAHSSPAPPSEQMVD